MILHKQPHLPAGFVSYADLVADGLKRHDSPWFGFLRELERYQTARREAVRELRKKHPALTEEELATKAGFDTEMARRRENR